MLPSTLNAWLYALSIAVTSQTEADFWSSFRQREAKAWSCRSIKDTKAFLEVQRERPGSAELEEAFAESFENAIVRNPDCILAAANELTGTTLQQIVRQILVPTFKGPELLDAIMLSKGHNFKRVWAEWSRIPTDPQERLAQVDRFAWTGPLFLKDHRLATLRTLAPLLGEDRVSRQNPHDPKLTDWFETLKYEGLTVYGSVQRGELRPIQVSITSAKWAIRRNLNVGAKESALKSVLGEPSEIKGAVLSYRGETEQIDFHVEYGKIQKIVFTYYAD